MAVSLNPVSGMTLRNIVIQFLQSVEIREVHAVFHSASNKKWPTWDSVPEVSCLNI